MEYPQTSREELPDLYDEIDEWLRVIENSLRTHFPVYQTDSTVEIIDFANATADDWVNLIDSNRKEMTSWTQKITGFSDRELQRQHGIPNAGTKFGKRKSTIKDLDEAYEYGEILVDQIPDKLTLETCLFTWAKMYENDQRRFLRMKYEEVVLDELREMGFSARKGEDVPGQPDVVIPRNEPFQVIGEVRAYHPKDKKKRYKEFRDEAREAKRKLPDAKFVAIANPGDYVTRNDREELRAEIISDDMDGVYFHDELDEFAVDLESWGVNRGLLDQ